MADTEHEDKAGAAEAAPVANKEPQKSTGKTKGALLRRFRSMVPTFKEGVIGMMVLNAAITGALLWKVETTKPPIIATVGVSSLTRMFIQKVGNDPNASPEALKLKTTMFQDVIRKKVGELAAKRGMIIIAREAILSGENEDLTPQIQAAIDQNLQDATTNQSASKGGLDADLLN